MSDLRHAHRGPLTWWVLEPTDQLVVTCSKGHRSTVQHAVHADGSLHAPPGEKSSMHCGTCNESLPLHLADWPSSETWNGPRVEKLPPVTTCTRCGKQEHFIGGWGRCGGYADIVCASCFKAVVFDRLP